MATPFYKKRPQCWLTILDIFDIDEKTYWKTIFTPTLTFSLVILYFLIFEKKRPPTMTQIMVPYWLLITPFIPFGQADFNKFKARHKCIYGNTENTLVFISWLLSPIIFFVVIIRYYLSR